MSDAASQLSAALADRYRIERELGAGGMATVYLAEDVKHHRKVAIKVLREDLAASLGATRFLREIEIAAQLQHPNILPLLDSGDANGLLYYVMPYVAGASLRERLAKQGELPVGEAVRLISEVLDALAHAHAHGVVHRDIKPDNVMLSGRHALVADFGVARAVSEASASRKMTTGGVALGTPAYMSPEQAAADPNVDHRADIYAVGAMAYELLTGQPPFTGTTSAQVLAAHVQKAPEPLSKHRAAIPAALEQIVMKCLAKRPADRWQTAEELLPMLEQLITPTVGLTPTNALPLPAPASRNRYLLIGIPAVAIAVLIAVFLIPKRGAPAFQLGQPQRVTSDEGLEVQQAISPDGKRVAYAAGSSTRLRIFVRDLAGGHAHALTDDTTAIQQHPRWSPADSNTVLFISRGGIFTAPSGGGTPRAIVPPPGVVGGAVWSPGGKSILYRRADSIFVHDLSKDGARLVARGIAVTCDWSSRDLIACATVAPYSAAQNFGNLSPSGIVVYSLANGNRTRITDSVSFNQSPVWAPDGRHLYFVSTRAGTSDVYSVAIADDGKASGEPQRMTTGLNPASISMSRDGRRLVYSLYTETSNIWSLPVPTQSPISAGDAKQVTFGRQVIETVRTTSGGKWLVYDSDRDGSPNIFRISPEGGEAERLTSDSVPKFGPDLSPDGRYLAYHAFQGSRDIVVMPLNGGAPQVITATPTQESYPVWAANGQVLAYYTQTQNHVFVARRSTDGSWQPPVFRSDSIARPAWSPDGRMLTGIRGGGLVVFPVDSGAVRSIYKPRPSSEDPVVEWPRWVDAQTIFFKSHTGNFTSFWSVSVNGGTPRLLVRFDDRWKQSYRSDWDTDGKRFFFPVQDRQSDLWTVELLKR